MKTNDITLGGILIALNLVILYCTSLLPLNTLSLLSLTSFIIAISILKTSIKTSLFVYIASALLGLLFLEINILILYILFFGLYGIIKNLVEGLKNLILEIILKLVFFNITVLLAYILFKILIGPIISEIPLFFLWAISQIVFLFFDYIFTIVITLICEKLNF